MAARAAAIQGLTTSWQMKWGAKRERLFWHCYSLSHLSSVHDYSRTNQYNDQYEETTSSTTRQESNGTNFSALCEQTLRRNYSQTWNRNKQRIPLHRTPTNVSCDPIRPEVVDKRSPNSLVTQSVIDKEGRTIVTQSVIIENKKPELSQIRSRARKETTPPTLLAHHRSVSDVPNHTWFLSPEHKKKRIMDKHLLLLFCPPRRRLFRSLFAGRGELLGNRIGCLCPCILTCRNRKQRACLLAGQDSRHTSFTTTPLPPCRVCSSIFFLLFSFSFQIYF